MGKPLAKNTSATEPLQIKPEPKNCVRERGAISFGYTVHTGNFCISDKDEKTPAGKYWEIEKHKRLQFYSELGNTFHPRASKPQSFELNELEGENNGIITKKYERMFRSREIVKEKYRDYIVNENGYNNLGYAGYKVRGYL